MEEDEELQQQRSVESISELLYERQINETMLLQILSPSQRDPYSIFQVRQIRLEDGLITMRAGIEQELIEDILVSAELPESALDQQAPALFDAIAEYVINKIIR